MKRILVTGAAGFIGSNLVKFILDNTDYEVVSLDKMTYAGDINKLPEVSERHMLYIEDICDNRAIYHIMENEHITDIIHLAAESHVDNSISDPTIFIKTNVLGTQNLLESSRINNMSGRFLHVSTDEVYGSLEADEYFTEDSKYDPSSPYSASKASSDHIVKSYFKTYGTDVVITNCSNNYGPRQHLEKLLPKVIHNAVLNIEIPVYGNGVAERDWLFVEDHCSAIMHAFEHGESGEIYLVGTDNIMSNNEIIDVVLDKLNTIRPVPGGYKNLIVNTEDRLGHDMRYAIDASKLIGIGWKPKHDFETSIEETINWYLEN